ncbi:UNVERIFIED_ORG: hypothetical protein GGE44_000224 [Rhizobium esperanzae]
MEPIRRSEESVGENLLFAISTSMFAVRGSPEARRLVFLDEAWIKTNMGPGPTPMCGGPAWSLKTLTFIAALRSDRIDAPWFIDAPINGELFTLYLERILVLQARAPKPGTTLWSSNPSNSSCVDMQYGALDPALQSDNALLQTHLRFSARFTPCFEISG